MYTVRRKLAVTAVALSAVAALVTTGTLALFTDQDTVGPNTFSTGTISLTTSETSSFVSYSNMMPGDTTTSPLVVTNAGSASLRYAVGATATNADTKGLKDQLVMTVKTIDVTTPATPCDDFDGTQLYSGDLDGTVGKILGDATAGQNLGDRTLASAASETLCFRVTLPTSSGNEFQGASSTVTFTFDSEQTKNN